eukprot:504769-Pyramimonas_sp.AAC.1
MDNDDSDEGDCFSEEHLRALCTDIIAQQLGSIKDQVDEVAAASIKESVAKEAASIGDSFKVNFDKCFAACQEDLKGIDKKLDSQIVSTLTPKLDEIRREFHLKYDDLSERLDSVNATI